MRDTIIEILEDALYDMPDSIKECNGLVDDGYIKSMDIVSLVMELNEEFGININVIDLTPENFNSVDGIVNLVEELI